LGWACSGYGVRGQASRGFWWGNRREGDHWRYPGLNGRIVLRCIFGKWERVETGWSWLRIGTDGGLL